MTYNYSKFDRIALLSFPDRGGLDVGFDRPPIIETAEVIRVDPVSWLVDVFTSRSARFCRNLIVPGTGVDRYGSMMGYMPKVGDKCLIVHPSDSYIPEIICYTPYVDSRTGGRGSRKEMRPGDMLMSTSDGNYVHVHAGGIVDIAATPLARRIFTPVLNQIKDFCENYVLNSAGGSVRWENRRESIGPNGQGTELVWEIKSESRGKPVLISRQGGVSNVTDVSGAVDHKEVRKSGSVSYRKTINLDGDIVLEAKSSKESYSSDYVVDSGGNLDLKASGVANLKGEGGVKLAKATEPAILGQTLLNLLVELTGALTEFATVAGPAMATLFTAPAVPGAGQAPAATAFATLVAKIASIQGKLSTILARDTSLS